MNTDERLNNRIESYNQHVLDRAMKIIWENQPLHYKAAQMHLLATKVCRAMCEVGDVL